MRITRPRLYIKGTTQRVFHIIMALFLLRVLWSAIWGALCAILSCLRSFRAKPPDLSADVCVVTGAGQGLGRHLALQLAADCGATVVLWDVNGEKVRAVAREITEAGGTAHAYVVDCSVREEVYRAADRVRDEVGDVAVLINNAAVGGLQGSFVDGNVSDENITKTFSVNALAAFWTLRTFLPWMTDNDYGYVVNVASLAVHFGNPHAAAYAAAKAALTSFSTTLRCELALAGKPGVSVTCVYLSFMNTGMNTKAELEAFRKRHGLILEPKDVARVILCGMGERRREIYVPFHTRFLKLFLPQAVLERLTCSIIGEIIAAKVEKKEE